MSSVCLTLVFIRVIRKKAEMKKCRNTNQKRPNCVLWKQKKWTALNILLKEFILTIISAVTGIFRIMFMYRLVLCIKYGQHRWKKIFNCKCYISKKKNLLSCYSNFGEKTFDKEQRKDGRTRAECHRCEADSSSRSMFVNKVRWERVTDVCWRIDWLTKAISSLY